MDELFGRLEARFGPMPELLKRRWAKEAKHCKACGVKFTFKGLDAATTPRVDYDEETGMVRGIVCSACLQTLKRYERPEQMRSIGRYMLQRKSPARSWKVQKDELRDDNE